MFHVTACPALATPPPYSSPGAGQVLLRVNLLYGQPEGLLGVLGYGLTCDRDVNKIAEAERQSAAVAGLEPEEGRGANVGLDRGMRR